MKKGVNMKVAFYEMSSCCDLVDFYSKQIKQLAEDLVGLQEDIDIELSITNDDLSKAEIINSGEVYGIFLISTLRLLSERFMSESKKTACMMKEYAEQLLMDVDKSDFEQHLLRIKRTAQAEILSDNLDSIDIEKFVDKLESTFKKFILELKQ